MLKIEVVDSIQDKRLSFWEDLLKKTENPMPFQHFEWIKHWWETFYGNGRKLFIVLATRDNDLIGIAPLMHKRSAVIKCNTLEFIGAGFFDYFDFIIKKGEEAIFLNSLIECLKNEFGHFELKLNNIFQASSVLKIITEKNGKNNFNFLLFPEIVVPYIELPQTSQLFYLQTKRLLRVDIARRERNLSKMGEVKFQYCNDINDARESLEDFFRLHIRRWESLEGYSVFKFKKRREFLRHLVLGLFDSGILNIYSLSLGEKKLAACIGFRTNNKFIYYSTAYDLKYAKFSPGKLLVSKLINYLIENKLCEFDFGIGEEYYKTEWPCKMRQLFSIYIYANKKTPLNTFLNIRREAINKYYSKVLPKLRKFYLAVYLWRLLNRRRGRYCRFQ